MNRNMEYQIVSRMTAGDLVAMNERAKKEEREALANKRFYAFIRSDDIIENRIRIGDNGELQIGDGHGNWRVELTAHDLAVLRKAFPGFKRLFVVTDQPTAEQVEGEV